MPEPSGMLYLASNSCLSVKISLLLLPHLQRTYFSSFIALNTALERACFKKLILTLARILTILNFE